MPSFRVIVSVGRLRPGVAAQSVETAAAEAAAELTVVEATGVDAVAGEARLTVRFLADGAEEALRIAEHTVAGVQRCAEVGRWQLTERVGGRWFRRA
ncbi:hypothetical protein ATY41_01455 [Leifsonia xyli subsp. xyli]|uniref:FMN-dependent dehydrogenase n=1 Tax=Leifsonia xyli subsp. xyli TaxID=59736 RepID=A0A1E2SP22_LEIXY|nr:hypothetical protein [Leifsonia xyli]ODA91374.1 hypothetical protein ATY41_01455 [Leifsonia xyli subsp. xyli]